MELTVTGLVRHFDTGEIRLPLLFVPGDYRALCFIDFAIAAALITFILLAAGDHPVQVQLLVWTLAMRILMIGTSVALFFVRGSFCWMRIDTKG